MITDVLKDVLDDLFEGAYVVDDQRQILYWNDGATKITGYSKDEVVNSFCFNNILRHVDHTGKELCLDGCPLKATLETGVKQESSVFLHHKNGHRIPVIVRTSPIYDKDNVVVGSLEIFTDSRYKQDLYTQNRRLQDLSTKDPLTRIYNRRYIDFQIKSLINSYSDFEQAFGLLYMDIDNFKKVNDTYGHVVGDEVLKLVSRTLNSNIRGEDVLGRYGGEEFIVVVKCSKPEELSLVSEKLRILIEKSSIITNNELVKITVSIGSTLFNVGESLESLVNRADKAMYNSKQTGKNKVTVY
ncbi:Response regulator PleD [Candidatus Izimaplasma bacterium HR1]|jgi:diguanylate cyclase (GGDEF)-like protein/PAS domain S-box-containing protein|uniref:sensor domain-containing diguanylate cyclase n=1 Tax=Candidatus Izimoplasma sp. HR1 TaxID=1541959 RepID=UPI0004F84A80|nr:Response regulator PleD [Candidatus Izimaplasma bacterium HR1]